MVFMCLMICPELMAQPTCEEEAGQHVSMQKKRTHYSNTQNICGYLPTSSTEGLSTTANSDGSFPHPRKAGCQYININNILITQHYTVCALCCALTVSYLSLHAWLHHKSATRTPHRWCTAHHVWCTDQQSFGALQSCKPAKDMEVWQVFMSRNAFY